MRQVQINRNLILREDGKLLNVHSGEEFIPKSCYGIGNRYLQVSIKHKNWPVHKLVMKFFGPPKPAENYEIDHIDRNTKNNNITNLRWVTHQENIHNRKCSLPVGQRLCDIPLKEYHRQRNAERYKKNLEKAKEIYRQIKKDG